MKKLIRAARRGSWGTSHHHILRGVDIDATDQYGATALIHAARGGHFYVCELLIENGADISIKDRYGDTALLAAAKNGNILACKLLRDDVGRNGERAILLAVAGGHKDVCEFLLDCGISANTRSYNGTVLTHAIRAINGTRVDICRLLLERGADVNAVAHRWAGLDVINVTALDVAVHRGHLGICQLLSEYDADPFRCHMRYVTDHNVKKFLYQTRSNATLFMRCIWYVQRHIKEYKSELTTLPEHIEFEYFHHRQ